jgi:hypothetical protein
MKNVIVTVACVAVISAAGPVSAQPANGSLIIDNMQSLHISSGIPNSVHIKAMRDFLKRNKTAVNAEWMPISHGYEAIYTDRTGSKCRTVYNSKGGFVYTIKQYSEDQLSREVRGWVKSRYYDYTITLVEEIEQPGTPVTYVVHLQDATTLKNVRVCEGEVEVMEEYKRFDN